MIDIFNTYYTGPDGLALLQARRYLSLGSRYYCNALSILADPIVRNNRSSLHGENIVGDWLVMSIYDQMASNHATMTCPFNEDISIISKVINRYQQVS